MGSIELLDDLSATWSGDENLLSDDENLHLLDSDGVSALARDFLRQWAESTDTEAIGKNS